MKVQLVQSSNTVVMRAELKHKTIIIFTLLFANPSRLV